MAETKGRMIVADTGALIAVALIGLLPFVRRLLGDVLVPRAVIQECVADVAKPAASIIREALDLGWLNPAEVLSSELVEDLSNLLDLRSRYGPSNWVWSRRFRR